MSQVTREEVYGIMEGTLGPALLRAYPHYADRIWALLYEAQRRGKELPELYRELSSALFQELHTITRGSLLVPEGEGQRRVTLQELDDLADALLEPLFARYSRTLGNFEKLNAFAMRYTSLAALKFLCLYYREYASPLNHEIYARIIRENFEPYQYESWLK